LEHLYEFIFFLFHFILKIDQYLGAIVKDYGVLSYFILFLIIFCETGLVFTPILPGDSLLFAAGALCGRDLLNFKLLTILVIVAAVLGDTLNYTVGKYFGEKLFKENNRFLKKDYIDRTHAFYDTYGAKAIIFCRFIPIVRTFAPFIAGFGKMHYLKFMTYNILGGILWAVIFISGGYFFGDLPVIRESLTLAVMGIIFLSLLPLLFEIMKKFKFFST
jgi:membrane-associated protein